MRNQIQVLIAFALLLIFSPYSLSVHAAPARIALVIGNGSYEHVPLKNPVNDAVLMAETLKDVGFEVMDYANLDRRELNRAFLRFGRRIKEAGSETVSLVYYAGHGAQLNGENYLIPVKSKIEDEYDVDIEGVRASSLLRTLGEANAALTIIILDACRNNPFKTGSRSANRGLAKMDAPTGTLLAYSTAPGQVAEDGAGKNSAYTKALSLAMLKPGATVEQVFKRVRIEVMSRTLDEQVPWESSSLTGDFYFVEVPQPEEKIASKPVHDPTVEIEYWKSIANSNDPSMYKAYLDQYPEGLFKGIAVLRVASLTAPKGEDPNEELVYFQSIQTSDSIADFKTYLERYPKAKFAAIANSRIKYLRDRDRARLLAEQREVEKAAWDSISNTNDPALVRRFLANYPGSLYTEAASIKLVALETLANTPKPVKADKETIEAKVASLHPPQKVVAGFDGKWVGKATSTGPCRSPSLGLSFVIVGKKVSGSAVDSFGNWPIHGSIDGTGIFKAKVMYQRTFIFSGTAEESVISGKWYGPGTGCGGTFSANLATNASSTSEETANIKLDVLETTTKVKKTTNTNKPAKVDKKIEDLIQEVAYWKSIILSTEPADYEAYLAKYPTGKFVTAAKTRLEETKKTATGFDGNWLGTATDNEGCDVTSLGLSFVIAGKKVYGKVDVAEFGKWSLSGSIDATGKFKAKSVGMATILFTGNMEESAIKGKWYAPGELCGGTFVAKLLER